MPQKSQSEVKLGVGVTNMPTRNPATTDATTTHKGLEPNISPYGSFRKLPTELRILIWSFVLASKRDVFDAFKFMNPQQHVMVVTCWQNKDIDAALLRTCRAIYEETVPILYGKNRFEFYAPSQISTFAFGELHKYTGQSSLSDTFRLSLERYGRLSMIRSVTLSLSNPDIMYVNPNLIRNGTQEAIWSFWAEFFQASSEQQSLTFPVLEDLSLSFSQWKLEASDASKLRVEPILRRLRPSGGLQRLSIFGVRHEQNLNDFKHGFVREGGRFKALDNKNIIIEDEIVSYYDLHTVSKGVRDILQKDGVPAFL